MRATELLEAALVDGEWWSDDASLTILKHWDQYRERLAPGVRAPDFTTIDGAFSRLRTLHALNESDEPCTDHLDLVLEAVQAQERAGGAIILASHSRRDRRRELEELDADSEE
jgi:hypothetical protein